MIWKTYGVIFSIIINAFCTTDNFPLTSLFSRKIRKERTHSFRTQFSKKIKNSDVLAFISVIKLNWSFKIENFYVFNFSVHFLFSDIFRFASQFSSYMRFKKNLDYSLHQHIFNLCFLNAYNSKTVLLGETFHWIKSAKHL